MTTPEKTADYPDLWKRAQAGDDVAVGRILTLIEREESARAALLPLIHPFTGKAHRIGIAGPPGAGKSTLAAALAQRYKSDGARVGVVAVDPTSPRSGGALLGDRIRMNELSMQEGIFIRSLASRGQGGGLSLAAGLVADALDALGYDPLFLETVGVGQGEIDVVRKAHTVMLLLLPGAGDAVQLMKAGILEMADVLIVNKGDREGAKELAVLLQSEIDERSGPGAAWRPPVLTTTAFKGEGIEEVHSAVTQHLAHLRSTGEFELRRRIGIREQLRQLAETELLARMWSRPEVASALDAAVDDVVGLQADPATAAERLAGRLLEHPPR